MADEWAHDVRQRLPKAEATLYGGFKSDPDEYLIQQDRLPPVAISSGSDLRPLRPREMLGVFIGFRGRHMRDIGRPQEAEIDYLLARYLFPKSRSLYIDAMALAVPRGEALFEPGELGSPQSLAEAITEQYGNWPRWAAPAGAQAVWDIVYCNLS